MYGMHGMHGMHGIVKQQESLMSAQAAHGSTGSSKHWKFRNLRFWRFSTMLGWTGVSQTLTKTTVHWKHGKIMKQYETYVQHTPFIAIPQHIGSEAKFTTKGFRRMQTKYSWILVLSHDAESFFSNHEKWCVQVLQKLLIKGHGHSPPQKWSNCFSGSLIKRTSWSQFDRSCC